jgi:hypothetical protein
MELYYDEDQISSTDTVKLRRLIKLPLTLELSRPDNEYQIDCQTDKITASHFQTIQKIGEGTYSQIFLVERRFDRHLFCMKRINKAECR